MPIHDWTRVRANRFHHFHQTWTPQIAADLNGGLLPTGYTAMTEQISDGGLSITNIFGLAITLETRIGTGLT